MDFGALIVGICWTRVHMAESLALLIWMVQRSATLDGFIDLRHFIDSAVKYRHLGRVTSAGLSCSMKRLEQALPRTYSRQTWNEKNAEPIYEDFLGPFISAHIHPYPTLHDTSNTYIII